MAASRYRRPHLTAISICLITLPTLLSPATAYSANADPRHLTVVLPDGLSPRTIGFYLALQEGYYAERGLAVDFATNGTQAPSRLLADGKADLAVDLMPVALRLHQNGTAIQHIAQFFQHSSLALYCRPPISKPADLHGTTIGVWFGGEESSFYAWMNSLNISTFGEEDGVTVLRQGRVAEALADARLDCVTSTSYLAPLQMQASGITSNSRVVFRYEDLGVGTLEDGLYARSKDLLDKDRLDIFARFLSASTRGWQKLHDDRAAALKMFRARDGFTSEEPDQVSLDQTMTETSGKKISTASPKASKKTSGGKTAPVNKGEQSSAVINGIEASDKTTGQGPSFKIDNSLDLAALKASLDAVDALVDPSRHSIGQLDSDSYDKTINLLLTGAPEPVLKGAPIDAMTDIVWKLIRPTRQPKP